MPTCETEGDDPAKPQAPTTPQRSPAVRHPRNGSGDGKAAANKVAGPRNAPVRGKAGGKKPEPTLLTDFLLGRPSADRTRRRSSAVAPPAEFKASAVNKLQPPGGVKYRVKQWQQSSAAAVIEDPAAPTKKPDGEYLSSDVENEQQPPAEPHLAVKPEKRKNASPLPPRARGTPRKRVVSDSHWVRNRKKSPQTKQELLLNLIVDPVAIKKSLTTKAAAADTGKRLPKDFVKSNWANPPLERKIQDWAARIDGHQCTSHSGTTEDVADTLPTSVSTSSVKKVETPVKKAKTPTKAKTPEKLDKSKRLPKDFVKSNWANPPLERKIQDWAERTAKHNEIPDEENPEEQSKDKLDEKPREKPEEETESISDTPLPPKPTNLKRTPAKKSKPIKPKSSPKEFVENLLAKPPLERKIQGWMGLTDKLNDNMRGERAETVVYPDLSGPAKSTTLKRGPAGRKSKPKGLPKDFVESNWANPPLERKMQDWAARVNGHDTVPHDEEATELVPDLPTNPSNLNSKSVTSTRSPNGIRKEYVEANSVNPPFERKIQDWVTRTNDSDIAPHEERSKVTPRKVSRHVEDGKSSEVQKDGKSSEVQKSTGEAEPLGVARAKVVRETPLSLPPAPSDIDSAVDIRPMSQNQLKEETMGKARENNPKRNRSKSKIGRRGAIHGTVRPNAKRIDSVQDQDTTKQGDDTNSQLQSQVDKDRERRLAKEENARRQDRLANNKDPTRSRDLRTLAPLKGAQIDQTRQVKAKEYFDLDLRHSNGQRMACEVELIVRDSDHDAGDILICEVNARRSHYLLFQPLLTEQISVRRGDMDDDLIVMARGQDGTTDWQECFILKAEHGDVVDEFMVMFSDKPIPPAISRFDPEPLEYDSPGKALMSGALVCPDSPDVPIGEHAGFRDQTPQASPKAVDPFVSGDSHSKGRADYRLSLTPTQRDRAIEPVSPHTTPTRYRPRSKELSLATPTKAYPNPASNEKSASQSTLVAPGHASATEPPPPPAHKQKSSPDVATELQSSHSTSYELKHRRSSSPLKHEYQPSDYTTSSSTSYVTDSEDDDSSLESSGDGLTGTEDVVSQLQQVNDAVLPDIRLEPPQTSYCLKFKAHISCWRVPPGRWDDIHLNLCTVVITPGLIEAYPLEAFDALSTDSPNNAKPSGRPLIALVLTPIVMLRQSNPLDIEIHSQPLETSLLKSTHIVRFRSRNRSECMAAYTAANRARQDNEKYNRLQRDRELNDYDGQAGNEWDERKARYSWFGRKKSYRASARASSFSGSDGSTFSLGRTAFMALRRMSNGANGRLTPNMSRFEGGGPKSRGSSIFATDSAPSSSPRTRTDSSMAASGTGNTSVFDTNNLIIRVYRAEVASRWLDLGHCRIVIGVPPPGMFPDTRLNYGVLKHVTLTHHTVERPKLLDKHLGITNPPKENKEQVVFFDGVLGARRFTRVNKIGIVMNVEEEVFGPNGEIGMPGAVGGIGARQRKWMFKCSNSTQAGWIFSLLGGGG